MEKIIEIDTLDELDIVAKAVVDSLDGRTVVALDAPMGAGKTTLVSRIAAYLGAEDDVTSPTFAIVNQYEGDRTIYHFDMYRIERIEEALDFGAEEYLASGELCLVEWPEKIEPLLDEDTMVVKIEILSQTARRFVIR
ncbi:MAG: tRNA (adenosine(37)-N6)-threonylcarbamoyltransferase complex ATPase subunit type 1 TsaE [Alistipes sp.]|jgi:tRNA threonylcarbamoyladenosine biosynthesis protein TsaE|nr:tRNA (adenosine(37)-N6)-threonylcarbamoyltransferase complex ATPase subunit type 1 TsaE [Alistipes sp.]MBR5197054.1 tRNA (adenosine(37)-N6)-threonylcarbamoyltransferase complex ATPase subunit type 1 TsaE [Alistipes sp.]MBR5584678.1 tRNA (adenosine(37)-N6)-threonylcarbamoyltransferase complex ATPase subunit type 1 TsaE [Alistipes sp.]MBR6543947.1 tRNA (adenosine(37)-N6)-threonylcarbamoyltransferase complex ATPase subunit type 1 TsaE [Alistipes sp.]